MELMEIQTDRYRVVIKLNRDMLGTNPMNPDVMDTHILDRQRKIIAEQSAINKKIAKYEDAKQISEERGDLELECLFKTVEEMLGHELSDEEKVALRKGELEDFNELKETMDELEEKGATVFFRGDEGKIVIGSHMIMGFMKAAAEAISGTLPKKNGVIPNSATFSCSKINQHMSVWPDMIVASQDIKRKADGSPKYYQRSLRAKTAKGDRISLAKSEELPMHTTFEFEIEVLRGSPLREEFVRYYLSYGRVKGLGQNRNAGFGRFKVETFEVLED